MHCTVAVVVVVVVVVAVVVLNQRGLRCCCAGAFMTEGSRTKNSPEQVDALMEMLEEQSA